MFFGASGVLHCLPDGSRVKERCGGSSPLKRLRPGHGLADLLMSVTRANEVMPSAYIYFFFNSCTISAAGIVGVHREEKGRENAALQHPQSSGSSPFVVQGGEIFWPDWRRDKLDHFVCMYGFFYSADTTTLSQFMAHVAAIHAERLFIQTLQYAPGTSIKTLLKVLTPTSTSRRCVITLSAHDISW